MNLGFGGIFRALVREFYKIMGTGVVNAIRLFAGLASSVNSVVVFLSLNRSRFISSPFRAFRSSCPYLRVRLVLERPFRLKSRRRWRCVEIFPLYSEAGPL